MVFIPRQNLYQSPPNSGGNNGAIPSVYDPSWPSYTNLTPIQIQAFQSFPQDLLIYVKTQRWLAEISGVTVAGIPLTTLDRDQAKIGQLKQAFDNGTLPNAIPVNFFDATGAVHAVDGATATAMYAGVVAFVQNTYAAAATLVAGINAVPPTITSRKQIDAAYAAFAPNSPSAKNPSAT